MIFIADKRLGYFFITVLSIPILLSEVQSFTKIYSILDHYELSREKCVKRTLELLKKEGINISPRDVVKYAKDKKGLWFATIVSALIFGGIHFTNIFYGVKLMGLIGQVVSACGSGLLLAAIYLRGGNIWVLMLIHALVDAGALLESTFTVTTVTKVDAVSSQNPWGRCRPRHRGHQDTSWRYPRWSDRRRWYFLSCRDCCRCSGCRNGCCR